MPQLDISTFFSQVFWFLIFFSSLFCVVSCLFLPKLDGVINTRSKGLLDSLNISLYLLKLTEAQITAYNAALNQARVKVKAIMDDAVAQVEQMRADAQNILEEENKKTSRIVDERVEKFKFEYMDELKQTATNIALIYYSKLTNSKIKEEFVADFVSKEF